MNKPFVIQRIMPRPLTGDEVELLSTGLIITRTMSLEEAKRRYGITPDLETKGAEYFYKPLR